MCYLHKEDFGGKQGILLKWSENDSRGRRGIWLCCRGGGQGGS